MSAIQSFSKDLGQRQQEFIAISIFLIPTTIPDVIICLVTLFAKRHTTKDDEPDVDSNEC